METAISPSFVSFVSHVKCLSAGHLQALSVRAQVEAGLAGSLSDRPEEAQEEKPGKALIQVRDQRERGETPQVCAGRRLLSGMVLLNACALMTRTLFM